MRKTLFRTLVSVPLLFAFACGSPDAAPLDDGRSVEDGDPLTLTWVSPLTAETVEVGEPVDLTVATQHPDAHVLHFAVDGAEVGACDATAADQDCHDDDLWQWTTTLAVVGTHALSVSFTDRAGATVTTSRSITVLAAGSEGSANDPGADESERDPLAPDMLVSDGVDSLAPSPTTGMIVQDIGVRGYLDPSSDWHRAFDGGLEWRVAGQRVLLRNQQLDGSVGAITNCLARYRDSVVRYADESYVSRASAIAMLYTQTRCGLSDGHDGFFDPASRGVGHLSAARCAAVNRDVAPAECVRRMRISDDFAIASLVRFMASHRQVRHHHHDPPRIIAAYNVGSIRRSNRNEWRMLTRGNPIDRFVGAYNAFRTWEDRNEGSDAPPPFTPRPHAPLPQVPDQGGPRLHHPRVVLITYANYEYPEQIDGHARWLVQSSWMDAVGTEYGIGRGTVDAHVHLATHAPTRTTVDAIPGMLASALASGTLPPSDPADALYVLYMPASTRIVGAPCHDGQGILGYHDEMTATVAGASVKVAYAVIANCGGDVSSHGNLDALDDIEATVAHEVLEAATDPFPTSAPGLQGLADHGPVDDLGGEVADLCGFGIYVDGRWTAQRIWSNAEAAAGRNPCVPTIGTVYIGISGQSPTPMVVHPGQHVTLPLTTWVTAPIGAWYVAAGDGGAAAAAQHVGIRAGAAPHTLVLTFSVPPTARVGRYGFVDVFTGSNVVDAYGYETAVPFVVQ